MSRVIFIGKTGCGKTTLCQKLNELEIKYKKTQAVELYDNAIDTPGAVSYTHLRAHETR